MVIQGNVSLMRLDLNPSHPHYEMLKTIEKKVLSGSSLTKQLLGYASKGRYEIKPLQLNQLLDETSEAFGRTRKSITFHRDLTPDLFPIEADRGQMDQLLMNLMVNAADAMPFGGDLFLKTANIPHSEIRGKVYQPKPGDYVLLTVTDSGVGMDSKILGHIFDPFFTTKEFGKGTGLGLALVYGITKGHGGYIDVESEKGKGTTFKIYLPATRRKIEPLGEGLETIHRGTETILIIDDEEMVLEVGQKFLKFMGYKVLSSLGMERRPLKFTQIIGEDRSRHPRSHHAQDGGQRGFQKTETDLTRYQGPYCKRIQYRWQSLSDLGTRGLWLYPETL